MLNLHQLLTMQLMTIKHLLCVIIFCLPFFSNAADNISKPELTKEKLQVTAINEQQPGLRSTGISDKVPIVPNLNTSSDFSVDIPDTIYVCGDDVTFVTPDVYNADPANVDFYWTGDPQHKKGSMNNPYYGTLGFLNNPGGKDTKFPLTMTYNLEGVYNGVSSYDAVTVIFDDMPEVEIIYDGTAVKGLSEEITIELEAQLKSKRYTAGTWYQVAGPADAAFAYDEARPSSKQTDVMELPTEIQVSVAGVYTFVFESGEGECFNSDTITLEFVDIPIAYAGEDEALCVDAGTISYQLKGDNYGDLNRWDVLSAAGNVNFSNNTIADAEITISAPGVYQLTWTNINYDSIGAPFTNDIDTVTLVFVEQPIADFTLSKSAGCGPLDVEITNNSTLFHGLNWDFDVNGVSTSITPPEQTFGNLTAEDKLYEISLVAHSTNNGLTCADTLIDTVTVYPTPVAQISTDYKPSCSSEAVPLDIRFENESEGGAKYTWEFETEDNSFEEVIINSDATQIAAFQNSEVNGDEFTREIILTAETEHGCTATDNLDVIIYSPVETGFSMSSDVVCDGATLSVEAGVGASSYLWDFGNGYLAKGRQQTSPQPYINDNNVEQVYVINLTTTSDLGCELTTTDTITVLPQINAGFAIKEGTESTSYYELDTKVTDSSDNADWLIWNWGDNSQDSTAAGVVDYTHTFVNESVQKLYFNIVQTVYNTYGCTDEANEQVEITPHIVVDFEPSVIAGCSPLSVQFENLSEGLASYEWNYGDGNTSNSGYGFNTFVVDPTDLTPTTFLVTLTGITFWGDHISVTKDIVVSPTPVADLDLTISDADYTGEFINQSAGGTEYKWVINNDTIVDNSTAPTHVVDLVYANNRTKTISTILIASTGICSSEVDTVVRYVPEVVADFSFTPSVVCSPAAVSLESTSRGGINYQWEIEGQKYASDSIGYIFKNNTTSAKQIPVTLIVYGNDEEVDSITKEITVYPTPTASIEADLIVVTGEELVLSNNSKRAKKYNWDFGDGVAALNNAAVVNHTYYNDGSTGVNVDITLVASFESCKDTFIHSVIVAPIVKAEFNFSGDASCAPLITTFNADCLNANYIEWILPGGVESSAETITHKFENTGITDKIYNVSLIAHSIYGNNDTITKTVKVHPNPTAKIATDYTPSCSTNGTIDIEFRNESIGDASYSWSFYEEGDNTNPKERVVDSKTSQTYTFEVADENGKVKYSKAYLSAENSYGCADDDSLEVLIYTPVSADFVLSESEACDGAYISVAGDEGARAYAWNFGDGSTSSGISWRHAYKNSTNSNQSFDISLTTTSDLGCTATTTKTISILPEVRADFNITEGTASANSTELITEVSDLSENTTELRWNWGDGEIDNTSAGVSNLHHPYTNAGYQKLYYNILQRAFNSIGCSDDMVKTVEITPYFNVDFEPSAYEGCTDFDVQFVNKSEGAFSFRWDYGDGSETTSGVYGSHTFINNSDNSNNITYTVTLTGYSTWGDSLKVTKDITVYPQPDAIWDEPVIADDSILYQNISQRAESYQWVINGDTIFESTLNSPKIALYDELGQSQFLDIQLIANNSAGCNDIEFSQFKIAQDVIASFTYESDKCSPAWATLDASSSEGGYIYQWIIDEQDTIVGSSKIKYVFENSTNAVKEIPVTLFVYGSDNKGDTTHHTITVYPSPKADIELDGTVVSGDTLIVENKSKRANSYSWDFGDNQTSLTNSNVSVSHQYTNEGQNRVNRNIQLIASFLGECPDTVKYPIVVAPVVKADFRYDTAGCTPFLSHFKAECINESYVEWILPEGAFSNSDSLDFYFTNETETIAEYEISLVAHSQYGNNDTVTKTVYVYPNPVADFNTDYTAACVIKDNPAQITFRNNSVGADSLFWDFQTEENLFEIDTILSIKDETRAFINVNEKGQAQFRNVSLIARTNYGCEDKAVETVELKSPVVVDFSVSDYLLCHNDQVEIAATSGAHNYTWELGNGSNDNRNKQRLVVNYTNTSNEDSIYVIELITTSSSGCEYSTKDSITVLPKVNAGFTFTPNTDSASYMLTSEVHDDSENAALLFWNWSDGSAKTLTSVGIDSIKHNYKNTGNNKRYYNIIQTAQNSHGCFDVASRKVVVYPKFIVDFTPQVIEGCSPLTVQFTNNSIGVHSYKWEFGDNTVNDTLTHIIHQFVNESAIAKTYSVTLTGYTYWGKRIDSLKVTKNIKVYPSPTAVWECVVDESNYTVEFVNKSEAASSYLWSINNKETSSNSLSYTPKYDLIDDNGRSQSIYANLYAYSNTDLRCESYIDTVIRVVPDVFADFEYDPKGCSPHITTLKSISEGGIIHQWHIGDEVIVGDSVNYIFENNTDTIQRTTITLFVYGNDSKGDTVTKIVTVYPTPKADMWVDGLVVSGEEIAIENRTVRANQYEWNFGDNTPLGSGSDTLLYYTYYNTTSSSKTYDITLVATFADSLTCTDTLSYPISVAPVVKADFEYTPTGCAPFLNTLTAQTENAAYVEWFLPDGTKSNAKSLKYYFENITNDSLVFNVTLIAHSKFGNKATVTKQVTVYPEVQAGFEIEELTEEGMSPLAISLTDTSVNAETVYWEYNGISEVSQAGDSFIDTLYTTSEYKLVRLMQTAVSVFGCKAETQENVIIYPQIKVDFDVDKDRGCSDLLVNFTNLSENAYKYDWRFGDGGTAPVKNPMYIYSNDSTVDTTFYAVLTATSRFGHSKTDSLKIQVFSNPKLSIDYSSRGYNPMELDIDGSIRGVSSYRWDMGDTTITDKTAFRYTYVDTTISKPKVYYMQLYGETQSGCKDSIVEPIQIYPKVKAKFVAETAGCSPFITKFENKSTNAKIASWVVSDSTFTNFMDDVWLSFRNNDSDTIKDVAVTMVAHSVYDFNYTDTFEQVISIKPAPYARIILDTLPQCAPYTAVIANGSNGYESAVWRIKGKYEYNLDSVFEETFVNVSEYMYSENIGLWVTNDFGCTASSYSKVILKPTAKADFKCPSYLCSGYQFPLENNSKRASEYLWDFGDTTTDTLFSSVHAYENKTAFDNEYEIVLNANNAFDCPDADTQLVVVHPEPDFEIKIISGDSLTMPNANFQAVADIKNGNNWKVTWRFSNSDTILSENSLLEHDFDTSGYYVLTLDVSSSTCSDKNYCPVIVYPRLPRAAFNAALEGCTPYEVEFNNFSKDAEEYLWDFGDDAMLTSANPKHTFRTPGQYPVTLYAFNSAGVADTFEMQANIKQGVTADFNVAPTKITSFVQSVFTDNESENAVKFEWDFSDGITSTEEAPKIQYLIDGEKDITLIAESETGCRDTLTQYAVVLVANAGIQVPNVFTPDQGGGSNGGGYEMGESKVFYPLIDTTQIQEYKMQIFNRWGQMIFKSDDYDIGWDGYYNGKLAKMDVYVYRIFVIYNDKRQEVKTGDVTLLR